LKFLSFYLKISLMKLGKVKIFYQMILRFKNTFIFIPFIIMLLSIQIQAEKILNQNLLTEKPEEFHLTQEWNWKYSPGDNEQWSKIEYDDKSWENLNISSDLKKIIKKRWTGKGWFRCHFRIEDNLKGKSAIIYIRHLGASEVYLNEKLIHRFGQIGAPIPNKKISDKSRWEAFTFDNHSKQVIAVRYANKSGKSQQNLGFDSGFQLRFMDLKKGMSRINEFKIFINKHKILLLAIPSVLAFLHLFLFLFYPQLRENLFYFFCLAGFAALFYSIMQRYLITDPGDIIFYYRIGPFLNTITISFLLLTTYSIIYSKIPKRYLYFILIAATMGIWGVFKPLGIINYGLFLFTFIVILECTRSFIINWPKEKKEIWIILIGLITLALLSVYQVFDVIIYMIINHITEPPRSYYRVYTYGGTVFIICMSIYLSSQFSRINKDLKKQLIQVKKLSEKNLLQERQARQREIEKRLLEAENVRKTRELEEARNLQLSMLPQKIPKHDFCEIEVFMKPATEVGGDYYDFHLGKDSTLTVVIGDATGHGMKAGTMVTAIKSLFGTYNESLKIPEFFKDCSKIIKSMNLGHLYMAMMILKIKKNKIIASTAGMPPALIFRKKSQTIDEIRIKGPPLGAFSNYSYKQTETRIGSGDTLLLMSDGFTELFNQDDEMLGIDRVKKIFQEAVKKSYGQIIASMNKAGKKWSKGRVQEDDITFIVIKFK